MRLPRSGLAASERDPAVVALRAGRTKNAKRGGLRTLRTDGEAVVYEMGIQPVAPHEGGLYMIDAEMNTIPVADYPLFELAALERTGRP